MAKIQLPHGYVAIIDDEDEGRIRQHRWRPLVQGRTVYAIARLPRLRGKQRSVYMHRLVVEAKRGERVAHRDRVGLNNVRANLKVQTLRRGLPEGLRWSRYTGVMWDAEVGKWAAVNGPLGAGMRIGLFTTEDEAARAYDGVAFEDCPGLRSLIVNFRDEVPPSGNRATG